MGQGQSGMPGQQPQGQGGQDKNKEGVSVLLVLCVPPCYTLDATSGSISTSLFAGLNQTLG